jgi:hypothetical protein
MTPGGRSGSSRDLGWREPIPFGEDNIDADDTRVPLGDVAEEFR